MPRHSHQRGFTLVELLVVITIIGVLVALLLPAVQSAREAARRVQCQNHLKQWALAAITHEEQIGHFPTGGWNHDWVGDADRGFGRDQPGGWAYNVLPFLEESSLHDSTGDGQPEVITEQQLQAGGRLVETALPIFNCPSRRPAITYPYYLKNVVHNFRQPETSGKLDYAICGGDLPTHAFKVDSFEEARRATTDLLGWPFGWPYTPLGYTIGFEGHPSDLTGKGGLTGVSFTRSEVGLRHVTDGSSNTYLIGEKHVLSDGYYGWHDDAHPWCSGSHYAARRIVRSHNVPGPDQESQESSDESNVNAGSFGSAHAVAFHMAFCDGSVRAIDYDTDLYVLMAGANRMDGTVHGLGYGDSP